MFSSTVSHGNDVYFWNTMPRSRPGPVTLLPCANTSPAVGSSSPAMIRSRVDLPQPEGPRMTRNSPTSWPLSTRSSISKLMFLNASTASPCAFTNWRETLRTLILLGRSAMSGCPAARAGHGGGRALEHAGGAPPREQAALAQGEQPPEQERRDADGDDPGVDAVEVQHLVGRSDHVAHAFARIHRLRQDHVGPADVVQDPERAEDAGKRGAEQQPQRIELAGAQRVGGLEQAVVDPVHLFDNDRQQVEEHAEDQEPDLHL